MSIITDHPAPPSIYDDSDFAELAVTVGQLADNGFDLYQVVCNQHRLIGILMQRVDALEGGLR